MFIVYFICKMIVDLAFIAMSLYLSFKADNFNYLWFLVVPIVSHLCTSIKQSDKDKEEENKSEMH